MRCKMNTNGTIEIADRHSGDSRNIKRIVNITDTHAW